MNEKIQINNKKIKDKCIQHFYEQFLKKMKNAFV